jgi:hypothetical protein
MPHSERLPPGADSRIRTDDLIITNDLLYQLSYIGNLVLCGWHHILAVAATLCFQNATVEICIRILNVAVHNHPGRRTKAEWGPNSRRNCGKTSPAIDSGQHHRDFCHSATWITTLPKCEPLAMYS